LIEFKKLGIFITAFRLVFLPLPVTRATQDDNLSDYDQSQFIEQQGKIT